MRHILFFTIFFATLIFSGCTSSANVAPKPETQKESKVAIKPKQDLTLKVVTTPPNARVRIINIKPKYHDNIVLKKGKYLIEVTKPGYKQYKQWHLLNKETVLSVTLKKIPNNFQPTGEVVWSKKKIPVEEYKYSRKLLLNNDKLGYFGNRVFYIYQGERKEWSDANRFCKNMRLQGISWRLPTYKEAKQYFKVAKYYESDNRDIFVLNHQVLSSSGYYRGSKRYDFRFICVADSSSLKTDLSLWQTASDIYKKREKNLKKASKNKKNSFMLQALSDAYLIKYGVAKFDNITYNKEKERFELDLISSELKSIQIANESMLKDASLHQDKYAKVYVTKNGTVINYHAKFYNFHRGLDLSNLDNYDYVQIPNKAIYDNRYTFANVQFQKDDINIYIPNQKNGYYYIGKIVAQKGDYRLGEKEISFNPDKLSNTYIKKEPFYKKHLNINVPKQYAQAFKKAITNKREFSLDVVFEVKNGKKTFKYIKNFQDMQGFMDKALYEDALNDVAKLQNYIQTRKKSKYYTKAKKRYEKLKSFYKGYKPKEAFYIQDCKGFYPSGLIQKLLKKAKIANIDSYGPKHWQKIYWYGMCRNGLLSGRGTLRFEIANGTEYIRMDDIYMKEGFITGDVTLEYMKHKRGAFWDSEEITLKSELKKYQDFQKYQKELK